MIVYVYDSEKQCSVPIISFRENELDHLKLMSKVKYLKKIFLFEETQFSSRHCRGSAIIFTKMMRIYAGVRLGAYWHRAYRYTYLRISVCNAVYKMCGWLTIRKSACAICVIIVWYNQTVRRSKTIYSTTLAPLYRCHVYVYAYGIHVRYTRSRHRSPLQAVFQPATVLGLCMCLCRTPPQVCMCLFTAPVCIYACVA